MVGAGTKRDFIGSKEQNPALMTDTIQKKSRWTLQIPQIPQVLQCEPTNTDQKTH